MGKIFCVMGKSCSGKDTVYRQLKERHPELHVIIPYTTRPIRTGEKNGVEYFFVNEEAMNELQSSGKMIERRSYDTALGVWHYFTADDGQIDLSKHSFLMIGTLVSYQAMRKYFGKSFLIPVYIEVDDGVRLERALKRERQQKVPQYEEMCRRFLADSEDFCEKNLAEAEIMKRFNNMDLDACLNAIEDLINKCL